MLAALFIIEPVLRMPALDKARLTSVDKSPVTLAQEDEFFPHFTYWHWEELLPPRYTDTLFDVAAQHSYFVPVRKLAQKDIQKMRMQSSRMRVT